MTNHFLFQAVVFLAFLILLSVGSIAHPAIVVIERSGGLARTCQPLPENIRIGDVSFLRLRREDLSAVGERNPR